MNALLKKEIRQLLPAFGLGLLLAFSVWLMPAKPVTGIRMGLIALPCLCCPAVVLLMILDSFGHELSAGTFSLLLSQPVPRRRIWRTKTSLLATAVLLIWLVWCISYLFHNPGQSNPAELRELLIGFSLFVFAAYSGGLWTVLLFRQLAAAFWLTVLIPTVLVVTLSYLADKYPDHIQFNTFAGALIVYSLAGFLLARWLFLRAQDVAWTGGTISFSAWRYFTTASRAPVQTRHRRPVTALLRKDLQLHGISLFCASVLLVLHLAVILWRNFGYAYFAKNPAASIVSECFWMLWLFMPVILGSTAVSEERKLGVMEGHLCLPVSRRVQFLSKFLLTLVLGVLLGSIPVLVEGIACRFGVRIALFKGPVHFAPYVLIPAVALGLSLAAFFASTLSRSLLQALGITIATISGCLLFMRFVTEEPMTSVCSPILLIAIALFVVPTTLAWLAWLNYRNYFPGWRLWRRNFLGLSGAVLLVVLSGAALYHRAWEVFEPVEPPHGSARLSLANPPRLRSDSYKNLIVQVPDGRIWFDYLGNEAFESGSWPMLFNPLPESTGPHRFLPGSNWVSATVRHLDFWGREDASGARTTHVVGYPPAVGIQSDGSLWVSDQSVPDAWPGDRLLRFGADTNWQQVAQCRTISSVMLLKTDGTLWRWGNTNRFDWKKWPQNWPELRTLQPQQIGTDSDWKQLSNAGDALVQKADGSVWGIDWKNDHSLIHQTNLDRIVPRTLSTDGDDRMACVRADGTLWVCSRHWEKGEWRACCFKQIGNENTWVATAITRSMLLAIKTDGSLWSWGYSSQSSLVLIDSAQIRLTRASIHNDWVALANVWDNGVALAADGSLWLWPDREMYERFTLLKLPKQPQFLGNVFHKSD